MMFNFLLLRFFGYSPATLESMDEKSIDSLVLSYWLSLGSAFLMALSGASIPFLRPTVDAFFIAISVGIFLVVFIFAISMQRLFVTMGGYALHNDPEEINSWRHKPLRIFLMLLMAAVFSQPILLFLNEHFSFGGASIQKNINLYMDKKVALFEFNQYQATQEQIDNLIRDKVLLSERLERLTGKRFGNALVGQSNPVVNPITTQTINVEAKRKALLIGSKSYTNGFTSLDNSLTDVSAIANLLTGMGYAVLTSEDESSDLIQLKINRYIKSLRPGDYSIIYYAGHGFQSDGHNYITSKDANGEEIAKGINRAIKVTPIVEQVASRKPALNVLLLDACQSWISTLKGGTGGLAGQYQGESGGNYFFSMAAAPGKGSIDGVKGSGKHSPYTYALLRYLNTPEDIQSVFSKVIKEVKGLTGGEQIPDVRNNLEAPFYLVEPRVIYKNKSKVIQAPVVELQSESGNNNPCNQYVDVGNEAMNSPLAACLKLEIDLTKNKIAYLQDDIDQNTASKVAWYRSEITGSGLISEKLHQMWHKKLTLLLNLVITLLIILLMVSGDLLRYFWPAAYLAISSYERLKNDSLRRYLKAVHYDVDKQIVNALEKYKSFDSSKIGRYQWWNADTDFYDVFPTVKNLSDENLSSQSAYNKFVRRLGEV
ncbi:caspase family protein [Polynucleobacter sp. AP-Capit-er-40B-B4]|uniref:caspase family protein n=1 Tax=Polynucleobacter sp. AP-Capit-er-40B-B4 TaxID=2576927 RepID=UPI001C0C631E|nr:caspase family protein [Polynucleobacter sp. AP-Capit-er-40B-B4]MBU3580456.1 caspase family protein [Polynucleobacter sp. AP-Capit-er-40B-B4]